MVSSIVEEEVNLVEEEVKLAQSPTNNEND
jgi:hypothetical protein